MPTSTLPLGDLSAYDVSGVEREDRMVDLLRVKGVGRGGGVGVEVGVGVGGIWGVDDI